MNEDRQFSFSGPCPKCGNSILIYCRGPFEEFSYSCGRCGEPGVVKPDPLAAGDGFVGDPHPVKDPVFRGAELVEESMQERIARAIQKRSGLSRAMAFVTADAVLEEIRTPTEAMRARRAEAVVRELRDPSREVIGALQGWAICEGYIPEGLNAAIDAAEKKVDEA